MVAVVLHNNVPDVVVDKVDVPLQLFTTFTVGVAGIGLIVKCNVTTLSQPLTFVYVCVGVAEAVYLTPYHRKLTQAVAVVSPVLGKQPVAVISLKETPLTELLSTTLLVVFELLLLSIDHEKPLCTNNFKLLAVSPFNWLLL